MSVARIITSELGWAAAAHTRGIHDRVEVRDGRRPIEAKGSATASVVFIRSASTVGAGTRSAKRRRFGMLPGLVVFMSDDFDAPLDDFAAYMP